MLGLMDLFAGGALSTFSIFALGIMPYITSSIIINLLTVAIPHLEKLSKEGENGRRKITQYTRYGTVGLSIVQGFGIAWGLQQMASPTGAPIVLNAGWPFILMTIITLTSGTSFLMWLGELISEKHVGNGISLLIFVGIVTRLPDALKQTIAIFDSTQLLMLVLFAVVAVLTIVGVVIITEGQRNVPVSYAKRVRGMKMYGGVNTHLPLRVNMAGVIPIIFAISIILFPSMIAQFFLTAKSAILVNMANGVIGLFSNNIFYGVLYFLLVFAFTYFYTEVVFHPDQISENLQKQGGFIPGIRPGKPTAEYLKYTTNRIILAGALFLGLIAVLPMVLNSVTGITTLAIGGTSLLIVVSVVIETNKQIESQLTMRDYEGL